MMMTRAYGGLVLASVLLGAPSALGKDGNVPGSAGAERRIEATAGATVPLPISSPAAEYRFARLTVPANFSLSRGLKVGHTWFVSVADLPALTLVPPANFSGEVRMEITFFREAKSDPSTPTLLVVAFIDQQKIAATNSTAALAVSPIEEQEARAPQIVRPISPEEDEGLRRAAELMKDGDVSSARLIYEEFALKGSWMAARTLGETYDPVFLKRLSQSGMRPSVELARKWYAVAAGLGDREAASRMAALPSR